jgi:hypothetical protein
MQNKLEQKEAKISFNVRKDKMQHSEKETTQKNKRKWMGRQYMLNFIFHSLSFAELIYVRKEKNQNHTYQLPMKLNNIVFFLRTRDHNVRIAIQQPILNVEMHIVADAR